jgi:hypothetical protein
MEICPDTGLSVPECACPRCLERQLDEFAPQLIRVRRVAARQPPRRPYSPITLISRRFGRRPSNSA